MGSGGKIGRYLHSASCQIKVFKPKGADRKLKTDKDKLDKRSAQDKLKYQPSYDSTLLSECIPLPLPAGQFTEEAEDSSMLNQITEMVSVYSNSLNANAIKSKTSQTCNLSSNMIKSASKPSLSNYNNSISTQQSFSHFTLLSSFSQQQTQEWLELNRFQNFMKTLNSFSGADLLALSRDDIIQICGPAEGIRLYNALRAKLRHPRLTLYLTSALHTDDTSFPVYKAFYLEQACVAELLKAVKECLYEDRDIAKQTQIARILYQPRCSNIHVLVSDEVVAQMKDESSFIISLIKQNNMESYQVVLKPQT